MQKQRKIDTDIYRKLAIAYYKDAVQEFSISDALNAHGITYMKNCDYLCHVIEEILNKYAPDLCNAILDLVMNGEIELITDNSRQTMCKTIEELLDVYRLSVAKDE